MVAPVTKMTSTATVLCTESPLRPAVCDTRLSAVRLPFHVLDKCRVLVNRFDFLVDSQSTKSEGPFAPDQPRQRNRLTFHNEDSVIRQPHEGVNTARGLSRCAKAGNENAHLLQGNAWVTEERDDAPADRHLAMLKLHGLFSSPADAHGRRVPLQRGRSWLTLTAHKLIGQFPFALAGAGSPRASATACRSTRCPGRKSLGVLKFTPSFIALYLEDTLMTSSKPVFLSLLREERPARVTSSACTLEWLGDQDQWSCACCRPRAPVR